VYYLLLTEIFVDTPLRNFLLDTPVQKNSMNTKKCICKNLTYKCTHKIFNHQNFTQILLVSDTAGSDVVLWVHRDSWNSEPTLIYGLGRIFAPMCEPIAVVCLLVFLFISIKPENPYFACRRGLEVNSLGVYLLGPRSSPCGPTKGTLPPRTTLRAN